MNRTALIALKEKVEAGTLRDQPHGGMPLCTAVYRKKEDGQIDETWGWGDGKAMSAYQGSLDAAKALHDAVLPDYGWLINGYRCWAHVWAEGDRSSNASFEAVCPNNPARAWLLAILSALIAMETEEPKEGY